jgi:hypothetical protein
VIKNLWFLKKGKSSELLHSFQNSTDNFHMSRIPTLPSFDFAETYSGFGPSASVSASRRNSRHTRSPATLAPLTPESNSSPLPPLDHSLMTPSRSSSNSSHYSEDDLELDDQLNEAMANFAAYEEGLSPTQVDFGAASVADKIEQRRASSTSTLPSRRESLRSGGSSQQLRRESMSPEQQSLTRQRSLTRQHSLTRSTSHAFYSPVSPDTSIVQMETISDMDMIPEAIVGSLDTRREEARAKALSFVADLKKVRESAAMRLAESAEAGNLRSSVGSHNSSTSQAEVRGPSGSTSNTSLDPSPALTSLASVLSPTPLAAPTILSTSPTETLLILAPAPVPTPATPSLHVQEPTATLPNPNSTGHRPLSPVLGPSGSPRPLSPPQRPPSPNPSILNHFSRGRPLPPGAIYSEISRIKTSVGRSKAYAMKINSLAREESGLAVWLIMKANKSSKTSKGMPFFSFLSRHISPDIWLYSMKDIHRLFR